MNKGPEILIVDDNKSFRKGLNLSFSQEGYSVTEAENGLQALEKIDEQRFDVIIADIKMPGLDGIGFLKKVQESEIDSPVIMITAHASVDIAVEAMKRGAFDFIEKPFKFEDLELKVKKALEKLSLIREVKKLSIENEYLKNEEKSHYDFDNIVGKSPRMMQVYSLIEKVANSNSNVLIYGESGTGKELVARAVHYRSNRSAGPFIKINCSVYPETLLESELFGHEKGAFSGATKSRPGRFEIADGGSIFIDEIGELSPPAQVKLLNVIQEKEFERIGDNKTRKVDVRIIAATNKDLSELVAKRKFREDLYYRLNVISITLPPLRERVEDIPALVNHFLNKYQSEKSFSGKVRIKGITDEALNILKKYHWPGNVRELENVIERAVVLAEGPMLKKEDLPIGIQKEERKKIFNFNGNENLKLQERISEYEKDIIENAYKRCNGNISKTAEELGVERNALRYKLKKYGLIIILMALFLFNYFSYPALSENSEKLSKGNVSWNEIISIKERLNAISKRQSEIEKESKEKSIKIEEKKNSGKLIPNSADSKIQELLQDVRELSTEYTTLQKEKILLTNKLSADSEKFIKNGMARMKELIEKIKKIDSNEEPEKWNNYYNEIFTLQNHIYEASEISGGSYEIIRGNIEINIFSENSRNIDEITEEIDFLEEGVNLLIESIEKLHSRLEYLYNIKEAKERLLALTKRFHSSNMPIPSDMVTMSNLQKDIHNIEEEIDEIKKNIELSESKVNELKMRYGKLQNIISNYELPDGSSSGNEGNNIQVSPVESLSK
ncbi:MAG: response regulator [Candidatus Schekmanbacteria bacterium]|nr:MAG: response regulator [Candidatus Schekmanbacteria bacterium]